MARSGWNIYGHINTVLIYVFVYSVCYVIKYSCVYFTFKGFCLHMERLKILIQIVASIPLIEFALNFFGAYSGSGWGTALQASR